MLKCIQIAKDPGPNRISKPPPSEAPGPRGEANSVDIDLSVFRYLQMLRADFRSAEAESASVAHCRLSPPSAAYQPPAPFRRPPPVRIRGPCAEPPSQRCPDLGISLGRCECEDQMGPQLNPGHPETALFARPRPLCRQNACCCGDSCPSAQSPAMMPFTRCTQVGPYAVLRDGIPSELESRSLLNPQQPKRCKKSLQAWPCVSCLLPKQLRPLRACKPVQREASELREGGEREGREDAVPIVAILADLMLHLRRWQELLNKLY